MGKAKRKALKGAMSACLKLCAARWTTCRDCRCQHGDRHHQHRLRLLPLHHVHHRRQHHRRQHIHYRHNPRNPSRLYLLHCCHHHQHHHHHQHQHPSRQQYHQHHHRPTYPPGRPPGSPTPPPSTPPSSPARARPTVRPSTPPPYPPGAHAHVACSGRTSGTPAMGQSHTSAVYTPVVYLRTQIQSRHT